MTTYISAADIVHETDRLGAGGYVTNCRIAVKKAEATHAKVFYDANGKPRSTKKWGAPCKVCFEGVKNVR